MSAAHAIRLQVEAALASRIPSALTPSPRVLRPVTNTGVPSVDTLLEGGLPVGTLTEAIGPECSGRTSLAMSFLSRITRDGKVCAWVDVSDTFDPSSAAATGLDLSRLLWIRCGDPSTGVPPPAMDDRNPPAPRGFSMPATKQGKGGSWQHPRDEIKGISGALQGLFQIEAANLHGTNPVRRSGPQPSDDRSEALLQSLHPPKQTASAKPWSRLEQALRVTDLLLQAGGFSAIVLDMGSIAPEHASRVPLATWFRYRAAAEKTQVSLVLLSQHACAKSSAGLVLQLQAGVALNDQTTVFTGIEYRVEVVRERFTPEPTNVISLRKPPGRQNSAAWQSRTWWAGQR